jgi:hypothetical protein
LYNTRIVICPLCKQRNAKRGCPALGYQICAVCCGTKRLTEIHCPSDCRYLMSSREHPPAAAVRQQQRDVGSLVEIVKDFNERQSQVFFLIASFLVRYQPQELSAVMDVDVAAAARALASTYETASRGVIYEHRAASLPAERLAAALKPVLAEAGKQGGSAFERDATTVLRRLADAAANLEAAQDPGGRPLLDLLSRVIRKTESGRAEEPAVPDRPRLIVP